MIVDATAGNTCQTTTANRLFLSHIDYTNYDATTGNNCAGNTEMSTEQVRHKLDRLFSKYGLVHEIFLSDKEDPNMMKERNPDKRRPPFGFVAMETTQQAQAALKALSISQQQKEQGVLNDRRLFRDVAPAHIHKEKRIKPDISEKELAEYRKRLISIRQTNLVCQVHSSHLDRFRDFVLERNDNVSVINSFSAPKGTSFLLIKVDEAESSERTCLPSNVGVATTIDDNIDHLQRFSRLLWQTWFVAPNLNRITLLDTHGKRRRSLEENDSSNNDDSHISQGNIRTGVVPAIYRSLSQLKHNEVSLRVAIFPPKLHETLLEELEDYNQARKEKSSNDCCKNIAVHFSPGNPTHTISIIQVHPGVAVNTKANGDNDKALYIIGSLEAVIPVKAKSQRKRSLSENIIEDSKYRFQQQRTSQVPQLRTAPNSNLKAINDSNTKQPKDGNNVIKSENNKSISRAYWKLQEAWERYKYNPPSLSVLSDNREEPMWALDCGAAPGGWTKFLFRPGIVERIYAIDPGKLSPDVVPGLDEANQNGSSQIIKYMDVTIQKALPELSVQLREAKDRKNRFLDIWVSDMCVKDVTGQIDCFFDARSQGVVGPGTFFVLTLKCIVGKSATSFDRQTREQAKRLDGITRDVHIVHLFSNRSSERTILGYLI